MSRHLFEVFPHPAGSALTWAPGGEAIVRIDTLSGGAPAARRGPVAPDRRRRAARGARSRRTPADGARHARHARLVSHGERGGRLLVLSVASVAAFLSALAGPAHRRQRRVAAAYLGGFDAGIFGAGVGLA